MIFVKIAHGLLLLPAFFHCLKEEDQIKVLELGLLIFLQLTTHHSVHLAAVSHPVASY